MNNRIVINHTIVNNRIVINHTINAKAKGSNVILLFAKVESLLRYRPCSVIGDTHWDEAMVKGQREDIVVTVCV